MSNKDKKQALELDKFVELSSELARIALKCPTCRDLFRQAIQNYSHQKGGLTVDSSQQVQDDKLSVNYKNDYT